MSDFMTAEDALLLANQYTDEHGGGGGGTTNYNSLSNRPQINGTTLSGNKTGHQLGLQSELTFDNVPTQSSNNPVKSGGIYSALAEKVTAEAGKVLSSNDYTTTEKTKLAGIEAGAEVNVIAKIVLNGVELVPANKEVAINVITRAVNNLTNYYLKTETYTKTEVDALLSAMTSLTLEIVETLPTQDISTTTIYLVPVQGQTNVYMQYAYINSAWAQLGTTQVDLSNYYTKTQVDTLLNGKEDTLTWDSTPTASSDNPVTSGGVYTALAGKQDTLTFDNAPTENSNNPVKSGGVYTALSNKQDTLEFDTEPTLGSHKMVDSDAVAQALDDVSVPVATEQSVGTVKPDGTTITIDNDGTIHGSSGIQPDEADFTFDQGLLSLNADRRYFTGTQAEWDELNSADKALYSVVNITDDDGTATPLQLDDYQKKDLTATTEGATTVEGALTNLSTNKQPKTLASPITIGGESKTTVETALSALNTELGKRTVSSYDLFTDCNLTNGTTYTLFEFWEILYNTFGSCNLDAHISWNDNKAFYLTDGVTTTQMISNGRLNVSVENPNETWHLLHGTVQMGRSTSGVQLLTLFARVGDTLSAKTQRIGGDVYSTTETLTNKVWIDGKPIYRKVIDFGALPNTTTKTVAYNITNLDKFVRIEGYGLNPNSQALMPLPYAAPTDASLNVRLIVASNTVDIQTGSDRTDYNGYIILEYTKTTS